MPRKLNAYFFISLFLLFKVSICFIALPFNTIFIRNSSISPEKDYRALIQQNELYVNFTVGEPTQNLTSILKMDLYSFSLYDTSYNTSLSSTFELIDDERKINCISLIKPFTCKDSFHIPSFSSFDEFNKNKNDKNNKNIIKTEEAQYTLLKKVKGSTTKFNDMFENYGIIGLKLNFIKNYNPPEFVFTFKGLPDIKSHTFYLKFDDNNINGFFNSNNTGYFIVGEELTDDKNELNNIKYTRARERLDEINWDLAFDDIISVSKKNETIEYRPEYKHAELYVNLPYIIAPRFYQPFIIKAFFQELSIAGVCDSISNINEAEFIGYRCDSKSEIFMKHLNEKFPDLIFEHKELEEQFILKGKDLFTYNIYNKSDTYVYFAILFPQVELKDRGHPMSWIIGIPFFKKYTLSFNYDNKMIGYLKKKTPMKTNTLLYKKELVVIIVFVFSIILAFIFGMYTHKKINRKPRKSKANELDHSCEYVENDGGKLIN